MGKNDTLKSPIMVNHSDVDNYHWIVYIKDMTTEKCYLIPEGNWKIGRKDEDMSGYPDNLVVDIQVETEDQTISRYHSDITLRKNIIGEYSLFIKDSTIRKNVTYADGYRISNHFEFQLFDNSNILMGNTRFAVWLNPTAG